MNRILFLLACAGLTSAFAGTSYRVSLYRPTTINGTELKAGECKVELHDNHIVIKQGKTSAESTVKVENGAQKFASTTVGYAGEGKGSELQEIRLGGTSTKLIFEPGSVAVAGSK